MSEERCGVRALCSQHQNRKIALEMLQWAESEGD